MRSKARVRVAVDAMGGDRAPREVVKGAVEAALELGVQVVLVGDEARVKRHLGREGKGVEVVHAPEEVGMDEPPLEVVRRKPQSSAAVALDLLKSGEVDAIFSAGNTGVIVALSLLKLGRMKGVARPAIGTPLPSKRGKFVLIDAGANVDCKPHHLLNFAILGSIYAQVVLRKRSPKVGLVSIGAEPGKGDKLTKAAHSLLSSSPVVNFVGNIEGDALFKGEVDVAVCDGFVGNVILKVGEGFAEFFVHALKSFVGEEALRGGPISEAWGRFERRMDYAEYGGALLLGVPAVVVIGHGRSNSRAVLSALRVAKRAVGGRIVERIEEAIARQLAAA